jgi:hypothetical protein
LGELRNRFVHYKWTGLTHDAESKELANALAAFEKTVDYLRRYERREIFGDRKGTSCLPSTVPSLAAPFSPAR